ARLNPDAAPKVKQTAVSTLTLKPTTFEHFVKVQGQVEANQNIMVSPLVSGRITRIFVREGQQVKAGQLLAQIDDAIMRRSIEEVKTSLDLATIMFEKQRDLWAQEIGTEIQYLTAKNQKEALERRLATLEEQLDLNRIKAPIAGTIDEIMPKVGEMVTPGMPAFRIVNARDLSLKASLSEAYIPYVRPGDEVKITFPALDRSIDAKVSTVGQFINPQDRTFDVEVKLPSSPDFKPNMFGEIAINDRNIEEAIVVPLPLVQQSERGSFVYVAEQGADGSLVARRRSLVLGLSYGSQVQVIEGLQAGDQLINAGYKDLSDGQRLILDQSLAGR
ncbi:MAG: efflux RND transporter periplasmic adaptor subunit, partial [Bacteroidetes bacterium]